ncbi:ATP-binding protein [Shewanella sp. A14]
MAKINLLFNANQHQFALLRLVNWLLKIGLIVFATDLFGLTTPPATLTYILIAEAFYVGFSYRFRRFCLDYKCFLFLTLILDTLFWAAWLFYTGGATNAFVSLLLLPIAIAATSLPRRAPWCLTVLSTLLYTIMFIRIPDLSMMRHNMSSDHNMGSSMNMSSHYLGMWFNFVISALVLTITVGYIAKRIRQKNAELVYLREGQLRQERLLALGTASAQMAHQLATPLSTLRLLLDELIDELGTQSSVKHELHDGDKLSPSNDLINEMQQALMRCEQTLSDLRLATESIREHNVAPQSIDRLVAMLTEQVSLLLPETDLLTKIEPNQEQEIIASDMSLLPALLALIQNAAQASYEKTQTSRVDLIIKRDNLTQISINIRDFGEGISKTLIDKLGHDVIDSPRGMGIAILLSHASFERLGGQLHLHHHADGGTVAVITLPLVIE